MMKDYSQITFKYLKKQKRRTLLTIVGIVLSVALITAIGTMLQSLLCTQIEYERNTHGDYYFAYYDSDKSLYEKVQNHAAVGKTAVIVKGEKVQLNKDYSLQIDKYDKNAIEMLPINLKEGKLPEKQNEILIEKWIIRNMEPIPKIGDEIKLNINGQEKVFILSGFIESKTAGANTRKAIGFINKIPEGSNFNVFVKLKDSVSIKKYTEEFKKMTTKDNFATNSYLISALGQGDNDKLNNTLYIIVAFFIILVCAVTISVIYNSFNISVLERISQFGVLRSIGATTKQIRRIIFKEAAVLSAISIPIGIVVGLLGLKIVLFITGFNLFNFGEIKMSVEPKILLISCIIGLLSVFFSALSPAYKASKVSPIEAIINKGNAKKDKVNTKKRGFLLRKLNIEHLMAYNNLKKNKKRFRSISFSIGISVVLFLVFTSFVDMIFNVQDFSNETYKMSLGVYRGKQEDLKEFDSKDYDMIKNIDGVDKVLREYKDKDCKSLISLDKMNKLYLSYAPKDITSKEAAMENSDKKYNVVDTSVSIYKSDKLKESKPYIISGSIDEEKLNRENGVLLVQKSRYYDGKNSRRMMDNLCNYKVGDEIIINADSKNDGAKVFSKDNTKKVKVMAILKECPFGDLLRINKISIITTESVYKNIFGSQSNAPLLGFEIKTKDGVDSEKIQNTIMDMFQNKYQDVDVQNVEGKVKQLKQFEMEFKVFLYAFIIVISLISCVNIVNTVSTNVILRRREFSTLKAIGMTLKQIKSMVCFEGILYGLIGSTYGVIVSMPLSYFLYSKMGNVRGFGWNISWTSILIAMSVSIIIGLISVLIPMKRINDISIVEGIRIEV